MMKKSLQENIGGILHYWGEEKLFKLFGFCEHEVEYIAKK